MNLKRFQSWLSFVLRYNLKDNWSRCSHVVSITYLKSKEENVVWGALQVSRDEESVEKGKLMQMQVSSYLQILPFEMNVALWWYERDGRGFSGQC